jgi:hypothetical protein
MELNEVLARLEKSGEFKEWRAAHSVAYLAHAFVMLDEQNKDTWQVGYFDEQKNSMTTFVLQGSQVQVIPDQEVVKADQRILPLKPEDVKVPIAEALAIAQKTKLENYPQEMPAKTFFIIQHLSEHGSVFNITFFTISFKTINIKVSTIDGKVVNHSMQALAAFG